MADQSADGSTCPRPASPTLASKAVGSSDEVVFRVPLTIRISLGQPIPSTAPHSVSGTPAVVTDPAIVERASASFWEVRPDNVLAVRVGYLDDGDKIGDQPCIAASVLASSLPLMELSGPREHLGVPIRYLPADATEQLDCLPFLEAVNSIAYDDDARTGDAFALKLVNEHIDALLHVGPEYSWDILRGFLNDKDEPAASTHGVLVCAMYEFHGAHIKDALEKRLKAGGSVTLVLDKATFSHSKPKEGEFDRDKVFESWKQEFAGRFNCIIAPQGTRGLISDSYHIKVVVRDDDRIWLSSGNWKESSSQPVITPEQREEFDKKDLPGNREWHVVLSNPTLAACFRSHIRQDFQRSRDLREGPVSEGISDELDIELAIEEPLLLERRPARVLCEPHKVNRTVKVQPLLTPDKQGAVYTDAVLRMIRSARRSLLFQIPYITMPSHPGADRGNIDRLIEALIGKLRTLPDARVLLRSGGSKFSSPTHAAWFFKSKGVNIDRCVRSIENHHTKGMIVDGINVMIGSHNWSKSGVSLNRDASLIFEDADIAKYYGSVFEVDWQRSNPIQPRRFVKTETALTELASAAPTMQCERYPLSSLVEDD